MAGNCEHKRGCHGGKLYKCDMSEKFSLEEQYFLSP